MNRRRGRRPPLTQPAVPREQPQMSWHAVGLPMAVVPFTEHRVLRTSEQSHSLDEVGSIVLE